MSTANRPIFALLLVLSLLGGALGAAELPRSSDFDYDPPVPASYKLPAVKAAADGEVLDSHGNALSLRELTRGRITLLSFIYTRCSATKACPYATGVLKQLHQISSEDPMLARAMRLVSLSFDPASDTPGRMATFSSVADTRSGAAQWYFLTTRSQAQLQPILSGYGQAVGKKKNLFDPTGPLNHTLRVFLIDREGVIRNIYSADTLDPRLVLADVRTLMMELGVAKLAPSPTH